LRKHILSFFRRKELSKKQREEFWSEFFSKTPREKYEEDIKSFDEMIKISKKMINSLQFYCSLINTDKLLSDWEKKEKTFPIRHLILSYQKKLDLTLRAKALTTELWGYENEKKTR